MHSQQASREWRRGGRRDVVLLSVIGLLCAQGETVPYRSTVGPASQGFPGGTQIAAEMMVDLQSMQIGQKEMILQKLPGRLDR
ncbi:MAG: hypothetical protein P1P84_08525 [Deferrisomatales bacterium]|nr:hypothetical protein [Deferrisomatales bacterium]